MREKKRSQEVHPNSFILEPIDDPFPSILDDKGEDEILIGIMPEKQFHDGVLWSSKRLGPQIFSGAGKPLLDTKDNPVFKVFVGQAEIIDYNCKMLEKRINPDAGPLLRRKMVQARDEAKKQRNLREEEKRKKPSQEKKEERKHEKNKPNLIRVEVLMRAHRVEITLFESQQIKEIGSGGGEGSSLQTISAGKYQAERRSITSYGHIVWYWVISISERRCEVGQPISSWLTWYYGTEEELGCHPIKIKILNPGT